MTETLQFCTHLHQLAAVGTLVCSFYLRSLVLRYFFACFLGTSLAILVAFLRYFATRFDRRFAILFRLLSVRVFWISRDLFPVANRLNPVSSKLSLPCSRL